MIERPSLLVVSRMNLAKARHLKYYFENEEVLLSEPDPIAGFHIIQYLYACYVLPFIVSAGTE